MGPILLFDGVCDLCDASVRFVLEHERRAEDAPDRALRFAALQSPAATRLLGEHGRAAPTPGADPETVLLIEDGVVHDRSTAALRVCRHLRWPYRALAVLLIVPRPLRDLVYRFIARNRYRWFGKHETCLIPTPALRARFLSE